jgi:hypothetical protein
MRGKLLRLNTPFDNGLLSASAEAAVYATAQ